MFDSNAILLYLAEKTGQFLSAGDRGELLSWMMFIGSGIGSYSGQEVHFRHYAPKGARPCGGPPCIRSAAPLRHTRYTARQGRVPPGPHIPIADVSAWGGARAVPLILGEDAWNTLPHLKQWFGHLNARPAAQRANALKDKFHFKAEMDEVAPGHMFRHVAAK